MFVKKSNLSQPRLARPLEDRVHRQCWANPCAKNILKLNTHLFGKLLARTRVKLGQKQWQHLIILERQQL